MDEEAKLHIIIDQELAAPMPGTLEVLSDVEVLAFEQSFQAESDILEAVSEIVVRLPAHTDSKFRTMIDLFRKTTKAEIASRDMLDAITETIQQTAREIASEKVASHTNAVTSRQEAIYENDDGEVQKLKISPDDVDLITETIARTADWLLDQADEDFVQAVSRSAIRHIDEISEGPYIQKEVENRLIELMRALPIDTSLGHIGFDDRDAIILAPDPFRPGEYIEDILISQTHITEDGDYINWRSVKKAITNLNRIFAEINSDPIQSIMRDLNGPLADKTREILEPFFDSRLAYAVSQLNLTKINDKYTPPKKSKKKQRSAPKQEQAQEIQSVEFEQAEQATQVKVPGFELGWTTVANGTEARMFEYEGQRVVVIDAIAENLRHISDVSRANAEIRSDENEFDEAIKNIAKRIASGQYPHLPSQSKDMYLRGVKDRSIYADSPIWYPREISPNAKRVYFSYRKAESIWDENMPAFLKPDDNIVLIVAECTKDTQLDTLQKLTGQTRKYLKNYGAGSV